MFYNHEILTSRKYGVATVWLVATLGSKSTLKKVNKKAICGVDVPKACGVIMEPEAPMALRLQSNLLFGVSKVYDQQCSYVLFDTEQLRGRMVQMLRSVRGAGNELDPQAGKTRPDKLVIPDDPNFVPDLAFGDLNLNLDFDLDFNYMTTDVESAQVSSVLSASGSRSSWTSRDSSPSLLISVPSSGSGGRRAVGGFGGYVSDNESVQRDRLSRLAGEALQDNGGFLPDDDFAFDADGNLLEYDRNEFDRFAQVGASGRARRAVSDTTSIEERVRQQHEDARLAQQQQALEYEQDPHHIIEDDYNGLPPASPLDTRSRRQITAQSIPPSPLSGNQSRDQDGSHNPPSSSATSSYATAPHRRTRTKAAPKIQALDLHTEFHNREFRLLQDDYLSRMATDAKAKLLAKEAAMAKKNAEFYVWGQGIGRLGRDLVGTGLIDPFAMFVGDAFRDAMLGIVRDAGQKHDRSGVQDEAEEEGDEDERRVRRRSEDIEMGRGGGDDAPVFQQEEDDGMAAVTEEYEPEIGRHAPTPLADESTLLPWNLSASRHSSNRPPYRSSRAGSALPRRLTSASPLHGHGLGHAGPSSASAGIPGLDMDMENGWEYDLPSLQLLSDAAAAASQTRGSQSESHVPAAYVDTQVANSASWMRKTLDDETGNFLAFVERSVDQLQLEEESDRCISFEELLRPEENSRVVAAKAFLHCLSLATKGLLGVREVDGGLELGLSKRVTEAGDEEEDAMDGERWGDSMFEGQAAEDEGEEFLEAAEDL